MDTPASFSSPTSGRGRQVNTMYIAIAVVVLVVLGLGFMVSAQYKAPKWTGEYQAVFLSNGQVYFGKIASLNKKYAKLTDVFYLRVQRPLQSQNPKEDEEAKPVVPPQPSLTLIKLGNELHGPNDEMIINRDQLLFIEGLKDDSRVVKAIGDFKKQQAEPKPAETKDSEKK